MEILTEKTEITLKREILSACAQCEEMSDCVVPDTYPDIERVIYSCGEVLIGGKTVSDGKITVEGVVKCTVLYVGDDVMAETIKICTDLPYVINFDAKEANSATDIVAKLKLLAMEVKILNPRKILVRCEVGASIRCFNEEIIEVINDIAPTKGLYLKKVSSECAPVMEIREKTFAISEEISMPPTPDGYDRLLCASSSPEIEDIKFVGNKLIFRGELKIHFLAKPCGGRPPMSFFASCSFSQILEIEGGGENTCPELTVCMTGSEFKIDEDENNKQMISAELNMLVQAVISKNDEVNYIEDAYSNLEKYTLTEEKINLPLCREHETLRDTFRCTLQCDRQVSEIISATAIGKNAVSETGELCASLRVCAVYLGTDGKIFSVTKEEDFCVSTEICADKCSIDMSIGEIYAVPSGESIDLRIPFSAEVVKYGCIEINMIKGIVLEEDEDRCNKPSVIIIPKREELDLWELAKKYSSTTELIEKFNTEECDIILIPVQNM